MNEQDHFRIEAAEQFGFNPPDETTDYFSCTEAQLIAFAKACERAGRAQAIAEAERIAGYSTDQEKGALGVLIFELQQRNKAADAELTPIREAEETRFMTAQGYVRGTDEPGKRWVKISERAASVNPGCKHPCAAGSEYACECHRRMGNDFWFLPLGSCLDDKGSK